MVLYPIYYPERTFTEKIYIVLFYITWHLSAGVGPVESREGIQLMITFV
jgi:hypothetical protein